MHATSALQLAYTMVLGAMFAALFWERASISRVLVAPFAAVAVTLFGAVALALLSLPWGLLAGAAGSAHRVFNTALILVIGYSAGSCLARCRATLLDSLYQRCAVLLGMHGPAAPATSAGLTLAGVPVPGQDETEHFKLIGTAGCGKSAALGELIAAALARGDRAVIADSSGESLERLYNAARGDVILNPFHADSRKWDLFAEMDSEADIEAVSRSLIPEGKGAERAWNGYARTFLSELIRYCRRQGTVSDQALHTLVTATSQADLRGMLAGGPAESLLASGNERMFGPVRSVAANALQALAHTGNQEGIPFSVRRWVRGGSGVLFLSCETAQLAALRTLIAAWMRMAILETLTGAQGGRRLWLVVHGLDAVGAIEGLEEALVRLPQFGGRCVLTLRSLAQLSSTYGQEAAQSLLEHTGNSLILRCRASEAGGTAQYASRLLSEHQILRRLLWRGLRRVWAALPRIAPVSEPSGTQARVEPAQIEGLADFEGFLKLASSHWRTVRLDPHSAPGRRRAPSVEEPVSVPPVSAPEAAAEAVDPVQRTPAEPAVPVVPIKTEEAPKRTPRKAPTVATAARTDSGAAVTAEVSASPAAAHAHNGSEEGVRAAPAGDGAQT